MRATRVCAVLVLVVFVLVSELSAVHQNNVDDEDDVRQQMRLLSKQVTALLERRKEDLQSMEDHMRRRLGKTQELVDVKEEIRNLRMDIEEMRTGHRIHRNQPHTNQEMNDHKTIKWLSNAVSEARLELAELQTTLNSSSMLQNREEIEGDMRLLRTDVTNLSKELESARTANARYETELMRVREELDSVREHSRTTAVLCGKTKNQLKTAQVEWNFNWKTLGEKKSAEEDRPSRHQRYLRKRIIELERTMKHMRDTQNGLQEKVARLETDAELKDDTSDNNLISGEIYDRINGNQLENFLHDRKLTEVRNDDITLEERVSNAEEQQRINTGVVLNLTNQFSNFDKLHLSMLELLENVESIENRVDKTLPEFRKEISKLEVQVSDSASRLAALKEDQTNIRVSMKAIGVSVSNLQDKEEDARKKVEAAVSDLDTLKKSSSVQTAKLHDHILKTESSTADVNATKSTIHLVQELKSFEKEYKSIVNKLPHDCNAVNGPNGVYLISPGDGEPILAYCSQGWTTIQKRYDGSVNFNRNWNDYSNGFGSATGEHWLGNRNLHYLTKSNCTKLEINMKDIYGKYWQATYENFTVADYAGGFKLVVAKYHGNASDALDYQNKMEFSTVDNDRDISNTHCANNYEGGWWFSHCQHANLNGKYNLGLTWFDSSRNEWIAVATSEMRVKKRDVC